MFSNGRGEEPRSGGGGLAGLLVTADGTLARAFQQELRGSDPAFNVHVREDWWAALQETERPYRWVAVDIGCGVIPADALRLGRLSWPQARIAAIRPWWSDGLDGARSLADVVIHKPLRTSEVTAFLDGLGPQPAEVAAVAPGPLATPVGRRSAALPAPARPL
jgi:hypothetical protein